MQKGTVVNLKHFKHIIDFIKQNWRILLLAVFFASGIMFATMSVGKDGYLIERLSRLSENYIALRQNKDLFHIILKSFINNSVFIAVIFILGSSVNGVTLVPLAVGIKGYLLGFLIAYIYANYDLKGIALTALIIIPPAIIYMIFIFIFSKFAMGFSLRIVSVTLPNSNGKNLNLHFKQYVKRLFITLIPIILAAVFDGWLSIKLISHFKL